MASKRMSSMEMLMPGNLCFRRSPSPLFSLISTWTRSRCSDWFTDSGLENRRSHLSVRTTVLPSIESNGSEQRDMLQRIATQSLGDIVEQSTDNIIAMPLDYGNTWIFP